MDEEGQAQPLDWRAYAAVGAGWFLGGQLLSGAGLAGAAPQLWLAAAVFVAFAALCWRDGQACGALHRRLSTPGYAAIGVGAGLAVLGVVDVGRGAWTAAFVAIAGLVRDRGGPRAIGSLGGVRIRGGEGGEAEP